MEATQKSSTNKKRLAVCILIAAVVLVIEAYVLNHLRVPVATRSITPYVLWHQNDPEHRMKIETGEYVTFDQIVPNPLHDIIHRFKLDRIITNPVAKPMRLIKRVGCGPGDTLTFDANGHYYCNGKYLTTAVHELAGKSIIPFSFNGCIPDGKLFVVGDVMRSFDSRIYGLVDRARVKGVAWAIL